MDNQLRIKQKAKIIIREPKACLNSGREELETLICVNPGYN